MTQTMKHDWRDVLLKAASIVEEGWCQGAFYRESPASALGYGAKAVQSCASGAIDKAVGHLSGGYPHNLGHAAEMALVKHLDNWSSIVDWNDHPGRTGFEVAEAMRQAATT